MRAMILTAGEGTRFRPYTDKLPKPSLPFCGYPLLYYSLFQLRSLEISKLILNAYHLPEQLIELTKNIPACFRTPIEISNEKIQGKLLGSGGGIAYAQKLIGGEGPFLVLNGDEVILPFNPNFMSDFLKCFAVEKPLACLLTTTHPEAGKKFGAVWVDKNNRVFGFGKTPPPSESTLRPLHFLGTQIFDEKIFSYLKSGEESNILYDALTATIKNGDRVLAYSIDCYWYETGNLADFLIATKYTLELIQSKLQYLTDFYKCLGDEYSLTKSKENSLFLHKTAKISESAEISGFLVASSNSVVESGAKLQNIILNSNVKIEAAQNLENLLFL
jgi:mannose-1-phosphate guanylyltransferase